MIAWLNPGALVAIAAAALPIVVHLLLRARAARVIVPSVRFISATRESAIRIRRPSDGVLLLLRMLIVVCAALALAAPVVITESRTSAWMNRTIRAIVVDTSASVDPASAAEAASRPVCRCIRDTPLRRSGCCRSHPASRCMAASRSGRTAGAGTGLRLPARRYLWCRIHSGADRGGDRHRCPSRAVLRRSSISMAESSSSVREGMRRKSPSMVPELLTAFARCRPVRALIF